MRRFPGGWMLVGRNGLGKRREGKGEGVGETYLIDSVDPEFLEYGVAGDAVGGEC